MGHGADLKPPPDEPSQAGLWKFDPVPCSECQGKGTVPGRFLDGQPDPVCPKCKGDRIVMKAVERLDCTPFESRLLAALTRIADSLDGILILMNEERHGEHEVLGV
jgi:hypothetical protein